MAKDNTTFSFDADQFTVTTQDDGNIMVTLDPAVYESSRPDTITHQQETAVDAFRQKFIASVIESAGPLVADAMAKDVNLSHATIVCEPSNAFTVEAVVQRVRNGLNPKTREAVTTYGSTSVRIGTSYKKIGMIKKSCDSMSDRIRAAVAG